MENRINDVLAVVSLNEDGKIVLRQAVQVQRTCPCRIVVLNIIPSYPLHKIFSGKANQLKEEALFNLNQFLKEFFNGLIPENIIPRVLMGNTVKILTGFAQKREFCIVVLKRSELSTNGTNGLNVKKIDKIVGHSYCPVLLINKEPTPEVLKNILIPIDISVNSEKKLLWASFFATKNNAKIQIVSALNIDIDEQKSLASKNAEKIREMLLKRGIECEIEIIKVHDKTRHDVVLNYIQTKKSDLVVIRKKQIATYTNPSIGEFATEIIHHSPVPVFVVSQRQSDIESILQQE